MGTSTAYDWANHLADRREPVDAICVPGQRVDDRSPGTLAAIAMRKRIKEMSRHAVRRLVAPNFDSCSIIKFEFVPLTSYAQRTAKCGSCVQANETAVVFKNNGFSDPARILVFMVLF
eukprot:SAG31_NODE_4424_length_3246_cov_1.533524_4_plen_118_part_00